MNTKTDKPLNFAGLSTDADFLKLRNSLHNRANLLQNDIHRYLVAVAFRWTETGDSRPVPARINNLLADLPKGVRSNAIREWVEKHLHLIFVTDDTEHKNTFVSGVFKAKDLDMNKLTQERWYDCKPEPTYKPIVLMDMVQKLLKDAEKRMGSTKMDAEGHTDDVPEELLRGLKAAVMAFQNPTAPHHADPLTV